MFILYEVLTNVDIPAEFLSENFREAVTDKIESQYIGKIIKDEGVCIALYQLQIQETEVKEEGLSCKCLGSFVVFKPFLGEVLTGKIKDCNHEGITVSLNFIDAFIPYSNLAEPSSFDELERVFVWHYEEADLFYDIGETVRFKVVGYWLPEEEGMLIQLLGSVNQDGLGLLQWWNT